MSQAKVSFAKHIKLLFRAIDIQHMQPFEVLLDDYAYMSDGANDHANAQAVYDQLSSHSMPPGGPFWTAAQLGLFSSWMNDGYEP
ncbi:MAG: hypothetical protein ABSH13_22425 [Candidatus Acidiferrum sp.]|jgi:hypothetical protein